MNNEKKISICSRTFYNNLELRSELEKLFYNIKFNKSNKSLDGKSLVNFLKGSEIAVVGLEKMNLKTLSQLPDLKAVVKYGVGLDKIDLKYLKKNKIKFFHFPGFNRRSVSELVLSFMLSVSRKLIELNSLAKKNTWKQITGNNLSEKKIGIIGCGFIGKDLINLLKPFKCKIYVNDIVNVDDCLIKNKIMFKEKKDIFSECDFISIHIPFNKKNKNLINKKYLKLMKSTATLINTSRGGIVDEKELYKLLKKKSIGSAYFDVLNIEPPKQNFKILKLKNFFISPHIGGSTKESILKGGFLCIKKLTQIK
jgi:phosphoglycerate dehydrogenase-like enzyme